MKFIEPGREWLNDDEEVAEFHRCFQKSKPMQLALGMNVGQSKPVHWLHRVLDRLGLGTKSKQFRVEGERKRKYWVDPEVLNCSVRTSVCATFFERWKSYLGDEYQQPTFEVATADPEPEIAVTTPATNLSPPCQPVTTNEQREIITTDVEEMREITSWFTTSYQNSLEGLEMLLDTARSVLDALPSRIRQMVWERLPGGVKNAIFNQHREHWAFFTG